MSIELLATVIVPCLAAVLSLAGSLFSEISQRGRIKSDIEIYRSLTSKSDGERLMPDSLNMLSEHIERELSMLTGGKARWTCLPRSLLFLVLGGILFFALARLASILDLTDFLAPLYLYFYFLLLILGAWCLMLGLKNLYRYVELKSHLLLILDEAQTSLKALTKLERDLSKSVETQGKLSDFFRGVAISLEAPQANLVEETPDVPSETLLDDIENLKKLRRTLQEQDEQVSHSISRKNNLIASADNTLRNASFVEDRTLFSLSLKKMRIKLDERRSGLEALENRLLEAKDSIAWCRGAVDESIRLYESLSGNEALNKRVVLKDSSGSLSFDTSEELYRREHLENFFSDLAEGRFEVIRADGPRDTLVVAQQNADEIYKGHRTLKILGFLTAKNGHFPSYLRIAHAPVRHVP
ncbi:hypothetical protein [uncultured Slackia sp.]|uniref:hypothetical protein n=1 Tax=uncultured Slackia sp. TaxID=665903 RepID=UPI0025CEDD15|nr:hypothetical protein [uncultured Slackia sp.]